MPRGIYPRRKTTKLSPRQLAAVRKSLVKARKSRWHPKDAPASPSPTLPSSNHVELKKLVPWTVRWEKEDGLVNDGKLSNAGEPAAPEVSMPIEAAFSELMQEIRRFVGVLKKHGLA